MGNETMARGLIITSDVVFWDFDGVIKDSTAIKLAAYVEMFLDFGPAIGQCVSAHCQSDGGLSRYDRIPKLFKACVGVTLDETECEYYCKRYSQLVVNSVIACPFVPGAIDALERKGCHQSFILVTNTPKLEIDEILRKLDLAKYFDDVFGAPSKKEDVLRTVLDRKRNDCVKAVFIGDTINDFVAAKENNVSFILRRSPESKLVDECVVEAAIDDFNFLTD